MFDVEPSEWKELQFQTARMFTEIGCTTSESYVAPLVRGQKEIDVYVEDNAIVPRQTYAVECKSRDPDTSTGVRVRRFSA